VGTAPQCADHSDKKRGEGWLWWLATRPRSTSLKLRTIGDEEADALAPPYPIVETQSSKDEAQRQAGQLEGLLQACSPGHPRATGVPAAADARSCASRTSFRHGSIPSVICRASGARRISSTVSALTGLLILGCASLPQCYAHGEIANTPHAVGPARHAGARAEGPPSSSTP
jgi:hypothetical protein